MKRFLYTILLLVISKITLAQFYSAGQAPYSIHWQQINTENFQVIFPTGFEDKASYVADVLEHVYIYGSESLKHKPAKISVILHNETIVSNGFVSWAPRRIEMYSNPSQTDGVHDWLEKLAIHEFRHVVQIDKLNQGMTRILYFLFGEQAIGAITGLYLPMWFLEGDAVAIETAISYGGRGRQPRFEKGLRSQLLEKERFSYDKAVFGSYKEYVPNNYELGYQIVAFTRKNYGADVWAGVIDNVARRPYSIIPFSRGIKNTTGHNKIELYRHVFDNLDSVWQYQYDNIDYTEKTVINKNQKHYTSYNHLYFFDNNSLIALKTSLNDIPRIIKLHMDGSEELLFTPGWYLPNSFSYAAGLIAWTEYQYDLRWHHRNWSNIHIYDIETGKKQRLTAKSRLFAPAVSPDGTKIAVVETSKDYRFYLSVLDVNKAKIIDSFNIADDDFILTPAWHSSGSKVVLIAQNAEGKRLVEINLQTDEITNLWHAGHTEITNPIYYNDNIIFSGAFSGIDNIYLFDRDANIVFKIVSSQFGAYQPAVLNRDNYLAWSDYNSDGYQAAYAEIDKLEKIKLEDVENLSPNLYKYIAEQENTIVNPKNIKNTEHTIEPYYRIPHLFNLHSWGPAYVNAQNYEINPGGSVMFQNMLSTSFATVGYDYDINEQRGTWKIKYSYEGFYPVFDISTESTTREDQAIINNNIRDFYWTERRISSGLRVPLTFTKNTYHHRIEPSLKLASIFVLMDDNAPSFLQDNKIRAIEYRVIAHRLKRNVEKDLQPRIGHFIDLNYRHIPFDNGDMGSVGSVRFIQFLPGLFRHHSLKLTAAYQKMHIGTQKDHTYNYNFPNLINYPRGIVNQRHRELQSYSIDYSLPLFYPDLSIPYLCYFKRIWANMFFDYSIGLNDNGTDYLNTTGLSIHSDLHLFRFFNPFTIGYRTNYNLKSNKFEFDFLINFYF